MSENSRLTFREFVKNIFKIDNEPQQNKCFRLCSENYLKCRKNETMPPGNCNLLFESGIKMCSMSNKQSKK